jgi:acyl-CoA synthetase (AMP-forming)/AMP-acid ligase II
MVTTFWDVLEARSQGDGERAAIVQGPRTLTFVEWREAASAFADWYRQFGGNPGGRVLLWMDSSPDMAIAVLGLWKARAIVALMDPKSKAASFEHAVRTVSPAAVVCDDPSAVPNLDLGVPIVAFRSIDLQARSNAGTQRHAALATDPASIVFTSGSSGRPKGVTQSHGNLLRACEAVTGYLGLERDDRILCSVPWSFDYGYGQLLSTLMRGATQVLPVALNPFAICEAISQHRPTVLAGIPSLFTYLLRGVSPFRETDLSSIRTITNTGGKIPPPVFEELLRLLEGRRIFLNYGLTETYRTSFLEPELAGVKPNSVGRAIPGVDIVILREDGTVADPLEVGQIVHRGDYICLGYWNDPEATAKAVRPDPLAVPGCPGDPKALYTGDYGYVDGEGLLYFVGRRDAQLKSMGVRVSPLEVEEILYASGMVEEVAVVGRAHELLGDEIWAVVVPKSVARPEEIASMLTAYSRSAMSPYMMPRRYLAKGAMPKTTTGKIDYQAIKTEIERQ